MSLMSRTSAVLSAMVLFGMSLGMPLSSTALSQTRGGPLPSQVTLDRFGLEMMWWSQARLDPTRDKVQQIAVDETMIFVVASSGLTTAIDSETGEQFWTRQLGIQDAPAHLPVANEDLVLIVSATHMYALDKFTGELRWQLELPGYPAAEPAMDEERVYMGMLDGSLYAFSFQEIRNLQRTGRLPQYTANAKLWRFKARDRIRTQPLTNGRVVVFGTQGNRLISVATVRSEESQLNFVFETDNEVSAPLARHADADADYVLMAAQDFKLYCLNMNTGLQRWSPFAVGLPIRETPVVIGNDVYLIALRGGMHSINVRIGKSRWHRPQVEKFIAASEDNVYVRDELGNFMKLDRTTGKVLATAPQRNYSVQILNNRTDRIILATTSGRIVSLREHDLAYPIFHMHPERRPILPEFAPDEPAPPSADDTGSQ